MANITRTMADTAGFIPQVWAQRALDVLRANVVLTRLVTRDAAFEPAWRGKTLNIPYPGTFTAADKAADSTAAVQTPVGGTSVAVTLSKHKYVDFIVEDFAAAQASSALLDRYVRPAAIAIGDAVEKDLWALYAGLSQSVGTIGTDVSETTVRAARRKLNDALAPLTPRHLVISSKDEIALLGATNLAAYFANARAQAVSEGAIGRLYGFDVWMSQMAPVGSLVTLGTQTSGTFTLTYGGQTTSGLAYNATEATVQSALEGLTTIGAGNVAVTGSAGGPYTVRFQAALINNLASLTANFGSLTTPANASIKDTNYNLAIHPEAFILATRPFQDPPAQSGVQAAAVMDPETGLAIRVMYQYSMGDRGVRVGFDILYGVAELRDAAGTVVYS